MAVLTVLPSVPIPEICWAIDRLCSLGLEVSLAITFGNEALSREALEAYVAEWEAMLA